MQGYMKEVIGLVENYIRSIFDYSKSLLELVEYKVEGKKIIILGPIVEDYGNELESEIISKLGSVERLQRELDQKIQEMKNFIGKRSIICPKCKGSGRITKKGYMREDGIVEPYLYSVDCEACGGQGVIKLTQELRENLIIITNTAEK